MSTDTPIRECESEIDHYTGHYVPYSLRRVCGFFNVPQILYYMYKGLWEGAYGLSSLSEKTRKSNRLQMLLQRQHFLLSYLKTLSVGPAGVWTHGLPLSRPALIHWANRAAAKWSRSSQLARKTPGTRDYSDDSMETGLEFSSECFSEKYIVCQLNFPVSPLALSWNM